MKFNTAAHLAAAASAAVGMAYIAAEVAARASDTAISSTSVSDTLVGVGVGALFFSIAQIGSGQMRKAIVSRAREVMPTIQARDVFDLFAARQSKSQLKAYEQLTKPWAEAVVVTGVGASSYLLTQAGAPDLVTTVATTLASAAAIGGFSIAQGLKKARAATEEDIKAATDRPAPKGMGA